MTREVLEKVARYALISTLAWLFFLPLALGALFALMATGLQAFVFGSHFLLELVTVNSAITLAMMFSYEIQWLWQTYQDRIVINAASMLLIWLLIESAVLALNRSLDSNSTTWINLPHWMALLLAVAVVGFVRLRKPRSIRARSANFRAVGVGPNSSSSSPTGSAGSR